ncbi:MAG: SEC-C metal-binding domain-containing protein [Acidimicrobiia bacterium]|nr:SEC-C metal-binding domain-containing protein [Acidimicrobiia bacterium]
MTLGRGRLANIDRRIFSELSHGDGPQTVKVPLSGAAWSTWRRYCDVLQMTMGEGIAVLIDSELTTVVDDAVDGNVAVLAIRADEQLGTREAELAGRERNVEAVEARQRAWSERLRQWEAELKVREVRTEQASKSALRLRDTTPKVGRNDRCPCASGLKYKHCHGLTGGRPSAVPR